MSVCILHALASIRVAFWHGVMGIRTGWEAIIFVRGVITGLFRWSRLILVKDSIEAYK